MMAKIEELTLIYNRAGKKINKQERLLKNSGWNQKQSGELK
jgi:hypothetical protein